MRPRLSAVLVLAASLFGGPWIHADDSDLASNAALQHWFALDSVRDVSAYPKDQEAVLRDPVNVPLVDPGVTNEPALRLIKIARSPLSYVRRGARLKRCEWALPPTGPLTLLPHVQRSRTIVSLLILDARYQLSKGRSADAVADLADALVFVRHVATGDYLILGLGQFAHDEKVIQATAAHLQDFDREALRALQVRLRALPESPTMSQRMLSEGKSFLEWLRSIIRNQGVEAAAESLRSVIGGERDLPLREEISASAKRGKEHMLKLVDDTRQLYEDAARVLTVSVDELDAAHETFQEKIEDANPVAKVLLGFPLKHGLVDLRHSEAKAETRMAMFKAAVAVALDGPSQLKSFRDPHGDGPFEYRRLRDGFELKSDLLIDKKPFAMEFRAKIPEKDKK